MATKRSDTVDENKFGRNIKAMMSTPLSNPGGRKMLKTLQLSTNGTLIGSESRPSKKPATKITQSIKPVKVFADKQKTMLVPRDCAVQTDRFPEHEEGTQTDITAVSTFERLSADPHNDSGVCSGDLDQEAYDLMVKDPIPEFYWRDLAEERRLSLAEALSENEMLHQSMEELQEENGNLSLLAGQAEYLAGVLNSVIGDDDKGDNPGDEVPQESVPPDSPAKVDSVVDKDGDAGSEPEPETDRETTTDSGQHVADTSEAVEGSEKS